MVRDPDDVTGIVHVMQQIWSRKAGAAFRCAVPVSYESMAPAIADLLRTGLSPLRPGERADASLLTKVSW